jgi:hypothetical protein
LFGLIASTYLLGSHICANREEDMELRSVVYAVLLIAAPLVAQAQTNTAPVGAADPRAGQTGSAAVPAPTAPANANNATTPGATGQTVVPGTSSTVAGDKAGTADTKTGGGATTGAGGGK